MLTYYNEWEPYCAAWLYNLIDAGHLPAGCVDSRDICSLTPQDIPTGATAHFFAGLGGWPYALQLAGWPTALPVWTASCPCQPFSQAGKRRGNDDARHLWPALFQLIRVCRPQYVIGEQVASAIGHGWLDGISADLEAAGYTVGACVLGAHSSGAPHIRQRLFWVAYTREPGLPGWAEQPAWEKCQAAQRSGDARGLADALPAGWPEGRTFTGERQAAWCGSLDGLAEPQSPGGRADTGAIRSRTPQGIRATQGEDEWRAEQHAGWASHRCATGGLADPGSLRAGRGLCGPREGDESAGEWASNQPRGSSGTGRLVQPYGAGWESGEFAAASAGYGDPAESTSSAGFWDAYDIIPCRDGKTRRIESGLQPLAHGVSARMGKLRAYGNSIVPQVAAQFIKACMEILEVEPC